MVGVFCVCALNERSLTPGETQSSFACALFEGVWCALRSQLCLEKGTLQRWCSVVSISDCSLGVSLQEGFAPSLCKCGRPAW